MPLTEVRVVAGAVVRAGKVLAALRSPTMALPGKWELPGGKVEPGETDAAALARELREELGVEVAVAECLGETTTAQPHRVIRLVAYACTLTRGEPLAVEHAALRWVTADELAALGWAPADEPLLAAVARALTAPR